MILLGKEMTNTVLCNDNPSLVFPSYPFSDLPTPFTTVTVTVPFDLTLLSFLSHLPPLLILNGTLCSRTATSNDRHVQRWQTGETVE